MSVLFSCNLFHLVPFVCAFQNSLFFNKFCLFFILIFKKRKNSFFIPKHIRTTECFIHINWTKNHNKIYSYPTLSFTFRCMHAIRQDRKEKSDRHSLDWKHLTVVQLSLIGWTLPGTKKIIFHSVPNWH